MVLDFDAFDWWEEDEPIVAHPRDPFHRIDVRRSSRPVRLEHEGRLLAESSRCRMLFEGVFPLVRYYLPADDVAVELRASDHRTECAYKGAATHYSATVGDEELTDVAWSYEDPLDDAMPVASLVCFYQERLDLSVDGERIATRPHAVVLTVPVRRRRGQLPIGPGSRVSKSSRPTHAGRRAMRAMRVLGSSAIDSSPAAASSPR